MTFLFLIVWSLFVFRCLAHNGEINTLRGNVNFMKAREGVMKSPYISNLKDLYPVVEPNLSDSGSLDCVLDFLVMAGGRSLPEVMITLKKKLNFLHGLYIFLKLYISTKIHSIYSRF